MTRIPLVAALCATLVGVGAWAQTAAPLKLPLDNLGLEHLDIVVPDTAASARFYARIFRTELHQQPVRDTLRYFVVLGDVPADRQVGYIAIGAAQGRPSSIGHYCVLAKVYSREALSGRRRPRRPVPLACGRIPTGWNSSSFSRRRAS
jgi:hypothetical protein